MKPLFKTSLISIASAVIGGMIVFAALNYTTTLRLKVQAEKPHRESIFDDDFFSQNDPFEEMIKFSGRTVNDISRREDNDFVYYDIQVDDLKSTSINTKIENGYITISGSLEKKSQSSEEDSSAQSIFKSTFNRTFPLPDQVDQDKMQMIPEKDKVVLKFPKMRSYGADIKRKKISGHLTI